jgi:hypothetical protein
MSRAAQLHIPLRQEHLVPGMIRTDHFTDTARKYSLVFTCFRFGQDKRDIACLLWSGSEFLD